MILDIDNPLLTYVLKYFGSYQAILETDEDGKTYLMNTWYPVGFAHWYEDILKSIPFKRSGYDKHERLQELLTELNLDKESFWGLILYLYDYTTDACKNLLVPQKTHQETYNEFCAFLEQNPHIESLTFKTTNKKTYTISDKLILDFLAIRLQEEKMSNRQKQRFNSELRPLSATEKADSRRKIGYFFARQLTQFLQIEGISNIKRRGKATISNKEKELILCSLYVCKFADNPENYLDLGYYNKLMKDFKGLSMNMSHKYELEIHAGWILK